MIVPLFLSEIIDDRYSIRHKKLWIQFLHISIFLHFFFSLRGTFLSALFTVENFGVLLAYIIGNYFKFYAMPLFSIILTAIFALLLFTIPESPIYLVRQKRFDVSGHRVVYICVHKDINLKVIQLSLILKKAKQSISYYKNIRATDKDSDHTLELEIDRLKSALGNSKSVNNNSDWTPETTTIARRAMLTGIVLVVLYIYSGITPMTFYAATIFKETGSNLSANMSAIVVGVIQFVGTCVATQLCERIGRKVKLAAAEF